MSVISPPVMVLSDDSEVTVESSSYNGWGAVRVVEGFETVLSMLTSEPAKFRQIAAALLGAASQLESAVDIAELPAEHATAQG